jgi:hypothetical protein
VTCDDLKLAALGLDRFGLTVTGDDQCMWLDKPANVLR